MIAVALGGAIIIIAAVIVIYRSRSSSHQYERGGRGFKGDIRADDDAFLSADPTVGLMGDEYVSPLIDPRLGSFSGMDGGYEGEGGAV